VPCVSYCCKQYGDCNYFSCTGSSVSRWPSKFEHIRLTLDSSVPVMPMITATVIANAVECETSVDKPIYDGHQRDSDGWQHDSFLTWRM
jgi:hypothetical protein